MIGLTGKITVCAGIIGVRGSWRLGKGLGRKRIDTRTAFPNHHEERIARYLLNVKVVVE
jgi:hypothetical protein